MKEEYLRIENGGRKNEVALGVRMLQFKDRETNQTIIYIPSLEISAYGESKEKAKSMLNEELKSFSKYLLSLSTKKANEELNSLGWKKQEYAHKNFSHAYIDKDGVLQNFDVDIDDIEEEMYNEKMTA